MPAAVNRPSWPRWYIAEAAIASIGATAYSPSRPIRSSSTWPGRSARCTASAEVNRPAASTTAPVSAIVGPAWQSPAARPNPPQVTALMPMPRAASRRRGAAARKTTITASPAPSAALTVASRIAGQAIGVAAPSSRVGSEKSTQPTNHSAVAMIRPSRASRAVPAAVAATPGSRSRPAANANPLTAVTVATTVAHPVRCPCWCAQ
ncbi:hypothetical protein GCM10027614_64720 [Micromonospora vulcania]